MNHKTNTFILIRGGQNNRYEVIDFLKGISILTIVLMHLVQKYMVHSSSFLRAGSSLGGSGVHVFLFCSGFGLYLSQLGKQRNYGEFIKRRFLRIYTPYIAVVVISSLIPFMYSGNDRLTALLSHVLLFKMFVPEYMESMGVHFWFVSTIIQLYLLFIPLCFMKGKLGKRKFLAVCMILSIAWWVLVILAGRESVRTYGSFCLQYLWEFALGMCVAEYLYEGHDIRLHRRRLLPVAVLGIGTVGAMGIMGGFLRVVNDIPSFMGYTAFVLLIYSLVSGDKAGHPTRFRRMKAIGRGIRKGVLFLSSVSYELYLVHILIFSMVFYFIHSNSFVTDCVLGFAAFGISILVAWGYSVLIQRVRRFTEHQGA